MIELIVVVAAVVLLAAALAPQLLSWIDEGRSTRAQRDMAAISAAMSRFFQDTTRWPGQVEVLKPNSAVRFLIVGDPSAATFPIFAAAAGIGAATCSSGLSGVTPNVTTFSAAVPSSSNTLNVVDFLLRPPPAADYPNWHGPYLPGDITSDPWGTAQVINVIPLFCGEEVTASNPGGSLGFAWILSGGPNRTLQTPFTRSRLRPELDDVGFNMSKRMTQAEAP